MKYPDKTLKNRMLALGLGVILANLTALAAWGGYEWVYADEYGPHQIEVLIDSQTRTTWRIAFRVSADDPGYECPGAKYRVEGDAIYLTFRRSAVDAETSPQLPLKRTSQVPGEPYVEFPLPDSLIRDGGAVTLYIEGRGRSWGQGRSTLPPSE